jgi:branched-chain amino acid transport system substrate-binding protein
MNDQATTKITKEVEVKRIIFLIIATLLVLGLVLPGCAEEEQGFTNWIDIAVAGPMTFIQGRDHWAGAVMARDEINADGGLNLSGTIYGIRLTKVDTNEILDTSGATGVTALTAVIDDVDFVVGGFRTEAVEVYREVAMEAEKIFFDDGAASNELQESVLLNYTLYKYWFKATPYNSTFLFVNTLKQAVTISSMLRAYAGMNSTDPKTTIGLVVENAEWTGAFSVKLTPYLTAYGFNVTGAVQKPDSDQTDLTTELTALKNACPPDGPMMVFTVLSGPPGKAYGMQQGTILPYSFTTGINVESQDIDYHHDTGAEYHCGLDTWGMNVTLTGKTLTFLDDYIAETGRYPTYCAATYDTIMVLALAIKDEGLDTDAIITWLEDLDNAYTGTASTTGYYPMATLGPYSPQLPNSEAPAGYSTPWYALTYAQVYAIYGEGMVKYYLAKYPALTSSAQIAGNWTTGLNLKDAWGASAHSAPADSTGAFLPHDTIYGPGWQTGQAVQWQPVDPAHPEGEWQKVGWWPLVATAYGANKAAADLNATEAAILYGAKLLDQYGNWNFAYTGSVPLIVPTAWTTHWHK